MKVGFLCNKKSSHQILIHNPNKKEANSIQYNTKHIFLLKIGFQYSYNAYRNHSLLPFYLKIMDKSKQCTCNQMRKNNNQSRSFIQ